ncbi:MAG: hypothetical protein DRQ62_10950 [Gammaproteobacteria bacterium]|nr:MAG: hypothetical protein DRQ62_10950 [Gammaproteobacteria bacterium]
MQFLKHYSLKYTPLSPVHIGADETYEPGNYVIDDESGALYGFDTHAAISGLGEVERKRLLTIVNGKPCDDMLTQIQAFFHQNKESLIGYASSPIATARGVADLYQKRIGKTAQHESRGRRVINKLEIERTFYNPVDNKPVFPGSSIKGAIRTALLDKINDHKKALPRERNQDFQARLFDGKFHTDPFRLISVSDAHWNCDESLPTRQVQFAVNRKREAVMKDGVLTKSQAEQSNLYQLLECVPALTRQMLQGSLQIQDVSQLRQDPRLPKPENQWDIKTIAKACNTFYYHLFQKELEKLKERNYLQQAWLDKIDDLLQQGLLQKMDKGEVFLLRIGRHSGAEGVTVDGARSIKIMQGRGNKPLYGESTPRTWWLAADEIANKTELLPFGWVLVEIDPTENNNSVQAGNNALADWYQQQLQKQTQLKEKIKQKQLLEAEKHEQEVLAEQQAQAKAEQEKQRFDNLNPLEQEIDQLFKKVPSSEHDTRLLQELNSNRWQGEEAKQVANKVKQLMQQADKWMPDFSGTNKKKIKLKQRSLQVQNYLEQ